MKLLRELPARSTMSQFAITLMPSLPKLTFTAIIDIVIVAVLIYQLLMIIRGRRAAQVLTGLGILALVYYISVWANLELLRTVLATVAPYSAFAIIVIFQSDIRRMLARIGRRRFTGRIQDRESAEEIVLALAQLASQRTGALMVLERDIGLRTFIESGVLLEAYLSRDLLLAIFETGNPLHDGAAIVQGNRVAAAACFLPLSTNPALYRHLGTRHRAAIGITEESDCLSLIVSEETGRISVAAGGEIELDVSLERARDRIAQHFRRRGGLPATSGVATARPAEETYRQVRP